MLGIAVTADGIPFNPTPVDGSTAEISQVVGAMLKLKAAARRSDYILVGDTKVISRKNILAACQSGTFFCAPAPSSAALNEAFRAIPRDEFHQLDYTSERELRKPPEQRTTYLGAERPWVLEDRKHRTAYTLRQLFVISSEEQAACRKNRQRQMEKVEATLRKVQANLGTRWYDTKEKVQAKVTRTLQDARVEHLYQTTFGEMDGTPTFEWERDEAAIAEAEALDGFYVLVTNLPVDQYHASAVLQLYKG